MRIENQRHYGVEDNGRMETSDEESKEIFMEKELDGVYKNGKGH